jgi:hypothetical protein
LRSRYTTAKLKSALNKDATSCYVNSIGTSHQAPHAQDARGVVRGNTRVNLARLGKLYMESLPRQNLCIAKTHLFGKSLIFSEEAETLSE